MKLEKGDLHFIIFAILVGSIFVFMFSGIHHESGYVVSENESYIENLTNEKVYLSSCYEFLEEDKEHDNYDGYCELYYGDVVGTNGVIASIEYLGEEDVKLNLNGRITNGLKEGERFGRRLKNRERVDLEIKEILNFGKNDFPGMVSFYYILSWDKPSTFCEGAFCTLEVGEEVSINQHEIAIESFCTDKKDCDLVLEIDSEEYKLKGLSEGSARKLENLTIKFVEFDINDGYMKFKHNYLSNQHSCYESDSGNDYLNNGSIKGFFRNESFLYGEGDVVPFEFNDYCLEYSEKLVEFYCGDDEYLSYEIFECEGECSFGKCVKVVENSEYLKNEISNNSSEGHESLNDEIVSREKLGDDLRNVDRLNLYREKEKDKPLLERIFDWISGIF